MNKKIKNIVAGLTILLIFLLVSVNLHGEIKLTGIFYDHMVLQQQTIAPIWGKASPDKIVRLTTSWDNKSYKVRSASNGNWKLKVKTPKAGGPYEINISDGTNLKLSDVLIGEVWICSGQSNMQMPMKGFRNQPVAGSNDAIATATNPSIRLCTVKRNSGSKPIEDIIGNWMECVPENVAEFSAAAWYFGQMIQKTLGVPVGLICAHRGGTRIEPWISSKGLKAFNWVKLPDPEQEKGITSQTPTVLFNGMINPLVGFAIRGVLWYQGESNKEEPEQYAKLMPGLIQDWRTEWAIGDFPFYFVQIAPFGYKNDGINSAFLREAQLKASTAIPNTGMACLLDAGEKVYIHPSNKKIVGERLAYLALVNTYNIKGVEFSGPVLKEMNVKGNIVNLTFDHANNGLTTFGKELENFKVAGEDKRFYPAKALLTVTGISLSSPEVVNPVAVRYAFEDFVNGDLYNTEGLPASSFRTDNWEK